MKQLWRWFRWFRWGLWYRLRPIYSIHWYIYKAEHGHFPLIEFPWTRRRRLRLPPIDVTRLVSWRNYWHESPTEDS